MIGSTANLPSNPYKIKATNKIAELGANTVKTNINAAAISKPKIKVTFLSRCLSDKRLKNNTPGIAEKPTNADEKPIAKPWKQRYSCKNDGNQVTTM